MDLRGMEAGEIYFEEDGLDSLLLFKVAMHLREDGYIAINAAASENDPPNLSKLGGGASAAERWIAIAVTGGSIWPTSDITNTDLDTSLVGGIPTSDLKIRVDAHAESVQQDGAAVDPLTEWTDLSGTENLEDAAGGGPALSTGEDAVPTVTFNNTGTVEAMTSSTSFPVVTNLGTFAVAFKSSGTQGSATAHLMGRYKQNGRSWRLYYDDTASPDEVVYQTRHSGADTLLQLEVDSGIDPTQTPIIVVLRGGDVDGQDWQAWINGIPPAHTGSVATSVQSVGEAFTVGAREIPGPTWGEAFKGQINQSIVYNTKRPDLNVALIMHQMAAVTGVTLGTPLPTYLKPKYLEDNATLKLDRKPIARINCYGGRHDANIFGQNTNWRPNPMNQGNVEAWLRDEIRDIRNACDDFEIMFNRPGGTYFDDIVPTYIWGSGTDPYGATVVQVTDEQWGALISTFDEFNLDDHNQGLEVPRWLRLRRGWFYNGGGLPIKDSGAIGDLETDGHMYNRVVGPATAASYKAILDNWTDDSEDRGDPRFRCIHCDATIDVYGLFTRLCNDSTIYENFLLVGEAIPYDDEGEVGDEAGKARKGAVWYAALEFPRVPWWNRQLAPLPIIPNKNLGYYSQWTTHWETTPIYFGIERGDYPYLHTPDPNDPKPGEGANMTLENIYRFILKGATPVAVSAETRRKVGTAWNYAMKRIPLNSWDRVGRASRVQR